MSGENVASDRVPIQPARVRPLGGIAVPALRGLSAQLLLLTLAFVMVAEVLIYVPSIAGARVAYLEARIMDADLATLSLEETPNNALSPELAARLLDIAGVRAIVFRGGQTSRLVLAESVPPALDITVDLRSMTWLSSIGAAFESLFQRENRVIRLIGPSRQAPNAVVGVVMDETPMVAHLRLTSTQILRTSALISLLAGGVVFVLLQWRLVGPMRRITHSMVAFRTDPEGAAAMAPPGSRADEVGVAERELAAMQTDLRAALQVNHRMAELGTAVSKINHDLRNILATAMLVSDRVASIDDPEVRRLTPPLIKAIDRAVALCDHTLRYGRATEPPPRVVKFDLGDLMDDVAVFAGLSSEDGPEWQDLVSRPFPIDADRDQLFRVLLNLVRNASQALAEARRGGSIRVSAQRIGPRVSISVADTGPGLPDNVRANLFHPFSHGANSAGSGLGLAIARDIVRGHGGDIELVRSDERGAEFRLELPHA